MELNLEPKQRIVGTLTHIIESYLLTRHNSEPRNYIGASIIGSPCLRKIWYSYKGARRDVLRAQTEVTFDVGHSLEALLLKYLDDAGMNVLSGEYVRECSDIDIPEFQGHIDGLLNCETKPVIVEIKTARDSSFRIFVNRGCRLWYPEYYAQVQSYMGMTNCHEAYVLAINKDTCELHDEYIAFDPEFYAELKAKAYTVKNATTEPPKINNSPMFYMCRICQYKGVCHGGYEPVPYVEPDFG